MPRVCQDKGTLSPSPAQVLRSTGLGGAPLLPWDPARQPDPPQLFGAAEMGGTSGKGRRGVPSTALVLRARWPGWGRRRRQRFPYSPPSQQAESCGQVAAPQEVLYAALQEGRARGELGKSSALCPPVGVGFPVAAGGTHGHRPPHAGNGPEPMLGAADVNRSTGEQDGTVATWEDRGGSLEHRPELPRAWGRCHPQEHPCRDGVTWEVGTRCPSWPTIPQLCGPRAGLGTQRVRVVTQPPTDIISINSGLCQN